MVAETPFSTAIDPFDPRLFVRADKHSITIAGHPTSIRIESPFWDFVLAEADSRGLPVSALVAEIDAARLAAADPPNLASAIRLWVLARAGSRHAARLHQD